MQTAELTTQNTQRRLYLKQHITKKPDITLVKSATPLFGLNISRSPSFEESAADGYHFIWRPSTLARHESACQCIRQTGSDHQRTTRGTSRPVPSLWFPSPPASARQPQSYLRDPENTGTVHHHSFVQFFRVANFRIISIQRGQKVRLCQIYVCYSFYPY